MIGCYKNSRKLDKALELFNFMKEVSIIPDVSTYNILMRGCEFEEQYDTVIELYNDMRLHFVCPDAWTYKTLYKVYQHQQKKAEMEEVIKAADFAGYDTTVTTFYNRKMQNYEILQVFFPKSWYNRFT